MQAVTLEAGNKVINLVNVTADNGSTLVQIRDLHFQRGDKSIFRGLDIDIPRGQITTIMGPSGTGKTTLLKLIGGQIKPGRGKILVDGLDVASLRRSELYALRKRLGMLFQSGALLTDLSVFENVAYPLREHTDLPESLIRHLVLMRLHAVGLRGARDLYPAELSGGMARRAALARALVFDPMMIMYDEPFTGQDPISVGVLLELISTVNGALGLTSLIVSHDLKESLSISDHVVIISEGKVVEAGTPHALQQSSSEWVQQFLHGKPDGPVPFQLHAPDYTSDLLGSGANND
jgi:phospholipid/cholesterol/gamma-HCH transport system ATP-binding protein